MSCTASLKAVLVVFGNALVCGSAPAFAGPTGRPDGVAGAGLGTWARVGFALGELVAPGDAAPVALTGVADPVAPALTVVPVAAVHPESALSTAKAATAAALAARRLRRTPVSMLLTTDEGTPYQRFPLR
jgi:hypothetical protein